MKRYLLLGFASVMLIVLTIALPGGTPSAAHGQASSSNAVLGGAVGGVLGRTRPLTPMSSPLRKPAQRLARVGSNLKAPRQTYSVDPEYPTVAMQAHIDGTVVVDAIIDEQGNVVQAQAISGQPLLIAAALKAVLQWKYEPTSLNGQPISVELQVLVNFK